MKKTILLAVVLAGLVAPLMAQDTNILTDEKARVSYAIGLRIGTQLKQGHAEVDTNLFMRGLNDAISGGAALMSQAEVQETMAQFSKMMQAKQKALMAEEGLKNKAEGEAFLTTNKNNPGVVTLPDGLQYKVIKEGDGPLPNAASTVTVNYKGSFISGTEFDSSARQGHPATFPVMGVIRGWTQALQLMKVGSKWELYVPADLGYGPMGKGPIPPNTVLIFDVELLQIQAARPRAMAPPQNTPLTSDIIKVPSAEELKKGAKIEVIKPEDVQKAQAQGQTNTP
jgi:FKBP-type peptidyl-prolyl cis-trans isomerase FklB